MTLEQQLENAITKNWKDLLAEVISLRTRVEQLEKNAIILLPPKTLIQEELLRSISTNTSKMVGVVPTQPLQCGCRGDVCVLGMGSERLVGMDVAHHARDVYIKSQSSQLTEEQYAAGVHTGEIVSAVEEDARRDGYAVVADPAQPGADQTVCTMWFTDEEKGVSDDAFTQVTDWAKKHGRMVESKPISNPFSKFTKHEIEFVDPTELEVGQVWVHTPTGHTMQVLKIDHGGTRVRVKYSDHDTVHDLHCDTLKAALREAWKFHSQNIDVVWGSAVGVAKSVKELWMADITSPLYAKDVMESYEKYKDSVSGGEGENASPDTRRSDSTSAQPQRAVGSANRAHESPLISSVQNVHPIEVECDECHVVKRAEEKDGG